MIIKKFRANNFRNIEACDIEFAPGVNLLYGKNAQGKTNAVEGIYLFSRGKSFRGREDSELVRFGSEGFRIFIEYESKNGTETLEYAHFGRDKLRKKNGYKIGKLTEMIGSFKSVLFYPDNLEIVKGSPEERRSFLNIAISQCYPSYIKIYADYKKALDNRNCLLKLAAKGFYIDERELESWSHSMAEYASHIYVFRKNYLKKLEVYAKKIISDISDGLEELDMVYESPIESCSDDRELVRELYIKKLTENVEKERLAGITLYGPHRDDVKISINGKDSRSYASQGQQRSVVLSLKLAEGEVIKEIFGEYPVFLFDDVLSELDERRRKYVLSGVGERQIIITSCEEEEFRGFTERKIDVTGGSYVSSHR